MDAILDLSDHSRVTMTSQVMLNFAKILMKKFLEDNFRKVKKKDK